jgi:hypothetical protein
MRPSPTSFECGCGAVQNSPDAAIPVGWSSQGGHVWCFDCTRDGVPARYIRQVGGQPKRRRAA